MIIHIDQYYDDRSIIKKNTERRFVGKFNFYFKTNERLMQLALNNSKYTLV